MQCLLSFRRWKIEKLLPLLCWTPLGQSGGSPTNLSWGTERPQFWRHPYIFDTPSAVCLCSSPWSSPDTVSTMPFSSTLNTLAIHQCSFRGAASPLIRDMMLWSLTMIDPRLQESHSLNHCGSAKSNLQGRCNLQKNCIFLLDNSHAIW